MMDEQFDRGYQAGRADLHGGIDRALARVIASFEAINRVAWRAPWDSDRRTPGRI